MAKKAVFNYKAYLKIIGMVTIAIGILALITAILIIVTKTDVNQLGLSEQQIADLRKTDGMTDDIIRIAVMIIASVAAIWTIFEGWLMRRAAEKPEKSTFLLVILVISVISGVAASISGIVNGINISGSISNVINLIINALALMSVVQLRKEVAEQ